MDTPNTPKVQGKWKFTNIPYYWEFTDNNKFIERKLDHTQTNSGTWEMVDDMVVVKYDDAEIGYSVLSFEDENNIVGENKHKDGSMYNLNLKKI